MTPHHIATLRTQTGLSQGRFAEAINAVNPLLRVTGNAISRYERDASLTSARTPDVHVTAALTSLWLQQGYPCTANGQPATLTTNHPQSSWGQPVVVIDGVAHGSAEVEALDLGDAPESIREAASRAGYR